MKPCDFENKRVAQNIANGHYNAHPQVFYSTSSSHMTQDIKPSNKIHTYDAKDMSELLNSHNQEFMFGHPVTI
jgi:hypothetical protein